MSQQPVMMFTAIAIVLLVSAFVLPRVFSKPPEPDADDLRVEAIERTRIALFEAKIQRENYEHECNKLEARLRRLSAERPAANVHVLAPEIA